MEIMHRLTEHLQIILHNKIIRKNVDLNQEQNTVIINNRKSLISFFDRFIIIFVNIMYNWTRTNFFSISISDNRHNPIKSKLTISSLSIPVTPKSTRIDTSMYHNQQYATSSGQSFISWGSLFSFA